MRTLKWLLKTNVKVYLVELIAISLCILVRSSIVNGRVGEWGLVWKEFAWYWITVFAAIKWLFVMKDIGPNQILTVLFYATSIALISINIIITYMIVTLNPDQIFPDMGKDQLDI
jgi:hypothetical protein